MDVKTTIGKFLYGAFFCVGLPVILVIWAHSLKVSLHLPNWSVAGGVAAVVGGILVVRAMYDLWAKGGGVPMNAYPPPSFVVTGAYRYFRHPIYVGAGLMTAGFSLIFHSPAGFYVVTPVLVILCAALVYGFEKPDLQERFEGIEHNILFGIPQAGESSPSVKEKLAAALAAFVPWLLLYSVVVHLGVLPGSLDTMLPFERSLPVVEWMEIPYAFTYVFVGVCPFIISNRNQLGEFMTISWTATALGIFLNLVLPFHAEARVFNPQGFFGDLIIQERSMDGPAAAFPSFHVIWALIAGTFWSREFPSQKIVFTTVTLLVLASCIAVGVHSIADVVAGYLTFMVVLNRRQILNHINRKCELLANSWREYYVGKMRVINHSLYAGIAAAAGALILALYSVPEWAIILITLSAALGGALWGQVIEGSPVMLRPFGYYGALAGGIGMSATLSLLEYFSFIELMAACAMASPVVQAVGRVRCLVQGCCHGRPTSGPGIRYINDHSRVCRISGLKGKNLHNTQLYSIAANLSIQLILIRMWFGGCSSEVLAGFYLILNGAARFVEEAYRGEVQTPRIRSLRMYQWLAIFSIVAGISFTMLPTSTTLGFDPYFSIPLLLTIITCGLTWAFAMGMDFPTSKARFSRLTG